MLWTNIRIFFLVTLLSPLLVVLFQEANKGIKIKSEVVVEVIHPPSSNHGYPLSTNQDPMSTNQEHLVNQPRTYIVNQPELLYKKNEWQ